MKVGPSAGTRCNVAKNAKMEKPREEYRAGIEGAGSKKGLTMNHEATGTRPKSNTGDKGRGEIMPKVVTCSDSYVKKCNLPAPRL